MDLIKRLYFEVVVFYISFGGGVLKGPSFFFKSCSIITSSTLSKISNSDKADFSSFLLLILLRKYQFVCLELYLQFCTNVYLYDNLFRM